MPSRSLTHRAPLLYLVVPYATGIGLQRALGLWHPGPLLAGAAALAAGSIVLLNRASWHRLACSGLALALAGAAAAGHARQRLKDWEDLPPREARLQVRLTQAFHSADPHRLAAIATIVQATAPLRDLQGQRVYVSTQLTGPPGIAIPSAEIAVVGMLSPINPGSTPGSFDAYLSDAGVSFRVARARMLGVKQPANFYNRFCDRAANRLASILGIGIAGRLPEFTGVYRAMLLGWQGELTLEQRDLFILSGTMHLFSVSGLHVCIVSVALEALLAAVRVPRPIAAFLVLIIVGLHVALTGASPAAVRAFLLVLFRETALLFRQPSNGCAALAAATLVVLLIDPLALFSASFQMSYGAVLAILLYGVPLADNWSGWFQPNPLRPAVKRSWLRRQFDDLLKETGKAGAIGIAATLVGTVTGITYFQVLAPVSLLVNLAVIPIANGVIIAGACSIACGVCGFVAASDLLNHAAAVILWFVDIFVRAGVGLPGGWFGAQWRFEWLGAPVLILTVAILAIGYCAAWRPRLGGYWLPWIVMTALILAAIRFG